MILNQIAQVIADGNLQAVAHAYKWLHHYGHLAGSVASGSNNPDAAAEAFSNALRKIQHLGGLTETGTLDAATDDLLRRPRCGCSDALGQREEARWRTNRLTYFVESFVEGLGQSDQHDLIRLAWKDWTDVADLTVTPVNSPNNANIVIGTGRGPRDNFDGPSGTLAWAYLPTGNDRQLQMKFDLSEAWIKDMTQNQRGILFRNVACHEFGHLLGLEHSRQSGALMAPFYSPQVVSPRPNDDVPRVVGLYGPARPQTPPAGPNDPPTPAGEIVISLDSNGLVTSVRVPNSVTVTRS